MTTYASFAEPFTRFQALFERATQLPPSCFPDPNAMSVATVGADGQPSNRVLLLKSFDEHGFVFYTNFEGRKGRELLAHPKAALCFYWPPLGAQVRIEGSVVQVSDAEADAYFASRPRGSQLGAWASQQSRPISEDGDLERRLAETEQRFEGQDVPRPPYWSGFRVIPHQIEFWHNRPSRLHDRQRYLRDGDRWRVESLYP